MCAIPFIPICRSSAVLQPFLRVMNPSMVAVAPCAAAQPEDEPETTSPAAASSTTQPSGPAGSDALAVPSLQPGPALQPPFDNQVRGRGRASGLLEGIGRTLSCERRARSSTPPPAGSMPPPLGHASTPAPEIARAILDAPRRADRFMPEACRGILDAPRVPAPEPDGPVADARLGGRRPWKVFRSRKKANK